MPIERTRPHWGSRIAGMSLVACLGACAGAPAPPPPTTSEPAPSASAAAIATSATAPPSAVASAARAPGHAPPPPPSPPIRLRAGGKAAVSGEKGVVTSVEHNATRVGADVLRHGGNAVDAAVAVAFALAVTHPSAGNIGGGGFMLVRLANGEVHAIDFRETAPASATTAGILQEVKDGAFGYRSVAVPGTVAGLAYARDHFGTRPLAELVHPAIELARRGHKLGHRQAEVLSWAWPKLDREARRIFGDQGKKPLAEGAMLRQPELAKTLERIAKSGPAGFYEGETAAKIEKAMRAHGGLVTGRDLAAYSAKERAPIHFSYRGFDVDTMPPPSMGGIAFAEIMLELERLRAHEAPLDSAQSLHFFIEAARRAYVDRRAVGADPDFNPPSMTASALPRLLDGAYLAERTPAIDPERRTPSSELTPPPGVEAPESPQTTHFSIVDAMGNAVSCTYTLSASYGAKIVLPGTGIVVNNALGAFSPSGPNEVAKGKRMASSMTPTIVSQNGKLVLVIGSPGGDTIPNTVAQVFRNLVDYGMTIDEAVAHGRIHAQYLPEVVRIERGNAPPKATLDELGRRGYVFRADTPIGDANDLLVDAETGIAYGYADRREGGRAEGVHAIEPANAKPKPEKQAAQP
jgi:gamma-glutamyltranspeptidase/glutathione hydrolase